MTVLEGWENFYVIVGSAAGALIGLQFVVLTLISERPPLRAAEASAAFATPTIVHFGAALLLSAVLSAPWQAISPAAALWGPHGPRWNSVRHHRGSAHANAKRIPPTARGLVVSCSAAVRGPVHYTIQHNSIREKPGRNAGYRQVFHDPDRDDWVLAPHRGSHSSLAGLSARVCISS